MVEPLTVAGLVWTALQLAARAEGLDEGSDPADLIADAGSLTGKLTGAGLRRWEPHLKARARAKKMTAAIDAAAHGAQVPPNELETAKQDAQDRVEASLVAAGDDLTVAITRLAGIEELTGIVHRCGGAQLRGWLDTPTPDAVVRLYPIVLDAALRAITEVAHGTPTAEKRALREVLTDIDGLNRRLDRLDEFAARIPPVVGDLATRHDRHLQDIADRYRAPDFEGRESEITKITAFATSATGPGWWWWRAPAWSGKTALMAHLTFHLPETVEVVPFFIRRAVAGADTAADVAAYIVARLAQLVGFTAAPDVRGEWARQTNGIRDLLDLAATSCAEEGKTLLILLDGLDEDTVYSLDPATRSGSIPALLPATLPTTVRVLLASRANPDLLPEIQGTVAGKPHPLRDPRHHHDLEASERANTIRAQADRDLTQLLRATTPRPGIGAELFSLVRASGGLLTGPELATLTGVDEWDITPLLKESDTARCFTVVHGHGLDRVTVYQIAHDGLVDLYTEKCTHQSYTGDTDRYQWDQHVRAALAPARDRLRAWATDYADQGWPEHTPRYLLEDYPTALDPDGSDLDELIDYLTTPDWIQRVTAHSGTPFLAVNHIRRLLGHLGDRASNRPAHPDTSPGTPPFADPSPETIKEARAAVLLAETLTYARAGLRDLPEELLTAHIALGNPDLALHLATLDTPTNRATTLSHVAATCAKHNHHTHALAAATAITDHNRARARALADVATAAAAAGQEALAAQALDHALQAATAITDNDWARARALAGVASAAAAAGNWDLAVQAATAITDNNEDRAEALAGVATAAAAAGQEDLAAQALDHAHQAATASTDNDWARAEALAGVATAAAAAGQEDLAAQALDHAHQVAAITDNWVRAKALTGVAVAAASCRSWGIFTRVVVDLEESNYVLLRACTGLLMGEDLRRVARLRGVDVSGLGDGSGSFGAGIS